MFSVELVSHKGEVKVIPADKWCRLQTPSRVWSSEFAREVDNGYSLRSNNARDLLLFGDGQPVVLRFSLGADVRERYGLRVPFGITSRLVGSIGDIRLLKWDEQYRSSTAAEVISSSTSWPPVVNSLLFGGDILAGCGSVSFDIRFLRDTGSFGRKHGLDIYTLTTR